MRLIVIGFLVFLSGIAYSSGADFLMLSHSSYGLSMGNTGTASDGEILADFYNPAGLPCLDGFVSFSGTLWFQDSYLGILSYQKIISILGKPAPFEFGLKFFTVEPDIKNISAGFETGEKLNSVDLALITKFSFPVGRVFGDEGIAGGKLKAGGGIKIVYRNFLDVSFLGFGFDGGVIYRFGFDPFGCGFVKENFSVGLAVLNLGFVFVEDREFGLPSNLRIGIKHKIYRTGELSLSYQIDVSGEEYGGELGGGIETEYDFQNFVVFGRVGGVITGNDIISLTFGGEIKGDFPVGDKKLPVRFSFAVVPSYFDTIFTAELSVGVGLLSSWTEEDVLY